MAGTKTLNKGEYLFRDGDPSDAIYVIKTGKLAVTKNRGNTEIHLAELKAGDMIGEMAFFDNKPRSAGAKALERTEVIELPFKALNAQFKTFPEWLKAIVRAMNTHLRNANQKLRLLEKAAGEEDAVFTSHLIVQLFAILGLVTERFGEKADGPGILVPMGKLRTYTIQVFQLPTNKMQKLLDVLQQHEYVDVKDLGEGRVQLTVHRKEEIFELLEYYNDYLFTEASKRVDILEKELKPMQALVHFGKDLQPNSKGLVTFNLTEIQEKSFVQLKFQVAVDDFDSLISKGLMGEKVSSKEGHLTSEVDLENIRKLYRHWTLLYTLLNYK